MQDELRDFCARVSENVQPLHEAYTRAMWQAATGGGQAAIEREQQTQAALMRFWADPRQFAQAQRLDRGAAGADPLTARTIHRIHLSAAKAQQDEATIERVTQLEAAVRERFYNMRAELRGRSLSDNEIDHILQSSRDPDEVREAWLASKAIGGEVAESLRELAAVRNQAAQAQGFRNHFQRSLTLNEIDEGLLFATLDALERQTAGLFAAVKAAIDRSRAARFGVPPEALMPWHYGDRFFQEVPKSDNRSLEELFQDLDPVQLALATYDGLGLEVRGILERSDLYPRPGKNQHAFCLDLDRRGDVRTLNNLQPDQFWTTTLLHELGHAIYDEHLDPDLPWILRTPPHSLSTEAMALMMGGLTSDPEWLEQVLGLAPRAAQNLSAAAREQERAKRLIFTRWALVMIHFERALYADPQGELDGLWWKLVERFQQLNRPPDRQAPDWAAKYHIGLAPVYYQNYELGYLFTAQLEGVIRQRWGGIVGRPAVGAWLRERVFAPGNRMDWAAHVEYATGRPLDSSDFIRSLT